MARGPRVKTEEELKLEQDIKALRQQQREISERIRDPRGLRRGELAGKGPRSFGPNGFAARHLGTTRPASSFEPGDQPAPKRRILSAVVKDGEVIQEKPDGPQDAKEKNPGTEGDDGTVTTAENDKRSWNPAQQRNDFSRRDGNRRPVRMDFEAPTEHVPRVLPKDDDPSLVKRNKRILGQLLGTLEKFQKEDKHLSASEAFLRRSSSLQRAEQRAREESERLRQEEREKIAENRRRDLTLRARVIAKAEEKDLELQFIQWSEHHRQLSNFLRTKAEPPIYYLPNKLDEDASAIQERKEKAFLELNTARRKELSEFQKKRGEEILANAEARWQNNRNARRENNNAMNLQETMDKELETHQLEHGPKTRKIPGVTGSNDEEDDVEDINVGEDDILEDVPEAGNGSPIPDDMQ